MSKKAQIGFTLIESVVALLLLAIMSVMAYHATEVILSANQRGQAQLDEEVRLHRAWQIISNDLTHLRPRIFSDGLGLIEPAYLTDEASDILVSFSRGNDAISSNNPTGLSRVRYHLTEDNKLLRHSQPVFLSPREDENRNQILLFDVEEIIFEQLTQANFFSPVWPPLNTNQSNITLPQMIRVTITLFDGSTTSRLFPGVQNG